MRAKILNEILKRTYLALILATGLTFLILIFAREKSWVYFVLLLQYTSPFFGKEVIIPLAIALQFTPLFVTITISLFDMIFLALFVQNWDLVWKIPHIGKVVNALEKEGKKFLERYQWIREIAFTSIIMLVILPFRGTGGIGAFIIAKLLGLSDIRTFNAIFIGTVFSNMLIAFSSKFIVDKIKDFTLLLIILSIISFLFFIDFRKVYKLRRFLKLKKSKIG